MDLPKLRVLLLLIVGLSSAGFSVEPSPDSASSRIALEKNWHIQSSCKLSIGGDALSRAGYNDQNWLAATVPHTVEGAQVDAKLFPDPFYGMNLRAIPGTTYPIGKIFTNLPMDEDSPYKCSWWYRTEFRLPAELKGQNIWLHFDGINYRANIWVNGQQIAKSDDVAGAYRTYTFNIKDVARTGAENAVAVEVSAQTDTDLGINFVDWNPMPADKLMGLWRPVYITSSGPVSVRYPAVATHFPDDTLETADLTVMGELQNGTEREVTGDVEATLEGIGTVEQKVTLAPNEHKSVVFDPAQYPELLVKNPKLWWPYPHGPQNLYTIQMRFRTGGGISDSVTAKFGVREITADKNQNGYELFRINHKTILIRGGGWSPDMFLRINPERMENELRYVRDLRLNTIRLEGKLETDEFFDLADRYGILIMAGWCCCDHWEHWDKWEPADHDISKASLASQIQRLRSHPSMLVWLNGSDNPPPADVETDYISILQEYHWPNPFLSSASATPTTVTGPSGVKMSGPYDFVPPSYWFVDPGLWGGAYGFNTETSPGPAPPLLSSLQKFIPKMNLWPHDDVWDFHAGLGNFKQTNLFDNAMSVSYGPPTSLLDYEKKGQAMAYDGERAMFEAYARNKYNSTGIIQWMLNNAWPSVIWHLYDYYLLPAGGYFGAKKANEYVHAQYSYDDHSAVVVNSLYQPQKGLKLRARVFDLNSKERFSDTKDIDLDADSVARVLMLPDMGELNTPYFVRLDLTDSAGKTISTNFYWIPQQLAEFDWEKSTFFTTPAKYSDMTALAALPTANVEWNSQTEHRGEEDIVHVTLRNPGKSIAFLVRADLTRGRAGDDVAPVLWDDNYISLLPGESRTISATVRTRDLTGTAPMVKVSGWNVKTITP
ncbi:MAG TPA: beta galactosidase jelly roll domain-containing protein [Terriglobales bacterium]|nr:beta galactosidase jelly roll domain-containing protein [Terriglobales bacterium]